MKETLKYYPATLKELQENWPNIPVIYMETELYDPSDFLSRFAQTTSQGLSTDEIVYATLNEKNELSYFYIKYQNDKYYYLADYYSDGSCFEHFYLKNEENLTNKDIFEIRLPQSHWL